MVKKENILEIAKYHINKVYDFNPYHKFKGIKNAEQFCNLIADDPAFKFFGLDDRRYVTARMGGNLITSLHRKLGDMYEEIFQYLLKKKFNLTDEDLHFSVDVKIGGRIQKRSTDGLIPANRYKEFELPSSLENWRSSAGIGLEIRSCYQIGDSKRIQADWDMAIALSQKNIIPVMLIFCNTSLISPVNRLAKSWILFEGEDTFQFIHELTDFDLYGFFREHRSLFTGIIHDILSKV